MQRRRIHGVLADPLFNPNAIFEDEYVEFGKQHESIDTLDGTTERETAPALA